MDPFLGSGIGKEAWGALKGNIKANRTHQQMFLMLDEEMADLQ